MKKSVLLFTFVLAIKLSSSQIAVPSYPYYDPALTRYGSIFQPSLQLLNTKPTDIAYVENSDGMLIRHDLLRVTSVPANDTMLFGLLREAALIAIPGIAEQYNLNNTIAQKLVNNASLIVNTLLSSWGKNPSFSQSSIFYNWTGGGRAKRGLWDDVVNFFEDVGCDIFASTALPGYLALYGIMHYGNIGKVSKAPTADQSFYISSVHGSLVSTDNVRFVYSSPVPQLLGTNIDAITFNNEIFVKTSQVTNTSWSTFIPQAKLLVHELQHVQQYKSKSYSLAKFGFDYLHDFCDNGFSYTEITLEEQARNAANKLSLFTSFPNFYNKWKFWNLAPILGFPISTTAPLQPDGSSILQFQKGFLQLQGLPGACVRVLPANYLLLQQGAQCNSNKQPYSPTSGLCQKYPEKPVCDPEYVQQLNQACSQKKALYQAMLTTLVWKC